MYIFFCIDIKTAGWIKWFQRTKEKENVGGITLVRAKDFAFFEEAVRIKQFILFKLGNCTVNVRVSKRQEFKTVS